MSAGKPLSRAALALLAEREKVEAAWAALNAADIYAAHVVTQGEATLVDAITYLAGKRDEFVRATIAAEHEARGAKRSNAAMTDELVSLRAEAASLRAKLDYATELLLTPMPRDVQP